MYQIKVFSFINGVYIEEVAFFKSPLLACDRLAWALNLDCPIFTFNNLDKYIQLTENGTPIIYRVTMPGHEAHPPSYLTISQIPE